MYHLLVDTIYFRGNRSYLICLKNRLILKARFGGDPMVCILFVKEVYKYRDVCRMGYF